MNMGKTSSKGAWICGYLCVVLAAVAPQELHSQVKYSQEDIEVQLKDPWSPVHGGGYYPLRMTVRNRGPYAELRFVATGFGGVKGVLLPTVEKRVTLAQNATTEMTLLLPIVSMGNSFDVQVYKNGEKLESINFPVLTAAGELGVGSFLIVAEATPDRGGLREYLRRSSMYYGGIRGASSASITTILPEELPDNWLAYSGVEVVMFDASAFTRELDEPQVNELLRWVGTGGSLIIYNLRRLDEQLDSLTPVFERANAAFTDSGWTTETTELGEFEDRYGKIEEVQQTLHRRQLLQGMVLAFGEDPFEFRSFASQVKSADSPADLTRIYAAVHTPQWHHVFSALGYDDLSWTARHGFSPRRGADGFMNFVNPNVQKLPTWSFITLITLFALIIGPVNYLVLKRRNMTGQMLWTTPLIAIVTSLLLFGWSTIANGTSNRVRLRSLSVLDQDSQTMVSTTRVAMYSGVTPRDGLRFEPYSAVYPIWQQDGGFQSGSVDWTDAQVLRGSFHRGNQRSQFMVTTPRTERGRLQFGEGDASGLDVTNGLEWDIESLLVCTRSELYYFGGPVEAGETLRLEPATEDDVERFRVRLARQSLKRPRVNTPPASVRSTATYSGGHYAGPSFASNIGNSQTERTFNWLTRTLSIEKPEVIRPHYVDQGLVPYSYVALLAEEPRLDIGLTSYRTTEELHLLLGFFGDE